MGLLDRLAVVISGRAGGAISETEKTAAAMDRAAVAQARLATTAAQLEQAQAKAAVVEAKAAGDADRLAAAQERLAVAQQRVATTRAEEGVAKASASYNAASKEVQGLEQSATGAEKALSSIGNSAGGIGGVVVAADAAQVALVGAAVHASESWAKLALQVAQFERLSGASADQASRFLYATKVLGLDADTTANALFRLGHNVEGSTDKLAKLGVAVAYNKDGQVDLLATLENVAQAYQNAGGGAKGSEIAFAAFGRQAKDLLPLLSRNREELQKLYDQTPKSEIISDKDQATARQFQNDLHRLVLELEAVEVAGGKALGPFVDANVKAFTKLAQLVEKVLGPVERFLDRLGISIGSTKDLGAAADTTATQVDDMAGSLDKAAASADTYNSAVTDGIGAVQGLVSADQQAAAAHKALADAQDGYAKKTRNVSDANRGVEKATRSVADAEQALTDARRQAPLDMAKARHAEAESTDKVAEATDDLAAAEARYGAQSRQAADARDKLASATDSHADAVDKLSELQKNPNRSVQDAEEKLADAKRQQLDAQEKLNAAKAEDPAAAVAKAEQDARDADLARVEAYARLVALSAEINSALGTSVDLTDTTVANLTNILNMLGTALKFQSSAQPFNTPQPVPSARGGGPDGTTSAPTATAAAAPAAGTVINVNVPPGTDKDLATRIAHEIGWSISTRGML